MKSRKLFAALLALLMIAILAGCSPGKAVSTGVFSGNTYTNDFLNLSFKVPDGWVISSKDEMASVFSVSADEIGSDDKEAEKKLNLGKQQVLYLAFASNHPEDYADGDIINISVIAENLSLAASLLVTSGEDYAKAAIENLKKTDSSYVVGDIANQEINGTKFAVFDATLPSDNGDMKQRFICAVKSRYAIVFTMTYFVDSELSEYQPLLDTISFK